MYACAWTWTHICAYLQWDQRPTRLSFLRHYPPRKYTYILKFLCIYVHVYVHAWGSGRSMLDSLGLEWHVVVNCPVWVLRTELRSSGRDANILACWASSPAPIIHISLKQGLSLAHSLPSIPSWLVVSARIFLSPPLQCWDYKRKYWGWMWGFLHAERGVGFNPIHKLPWKWS